MATKNEELKKSMEAYADKYKRYYAHYLTKYGLRARYTDFTELAIGVSRVIKIAFLKGAKWQKQQSEQEITKWISVKEKLPEVDTKVLVINDGNIEICSMYRAFDMKAYWDTEYPRMIKYWMPLPELPKGGAE